MPIINMVYKKKKGWKPGANTIAYYPLTSETTVNDMSGNGYTLTANGTYNFNTYLGVDCFNSQGTGYLNCTSLLDSIVGTTFTCSVRVFTPSSQGNGEWGICGITSSSGGYKGWDMMENKTEERYRWETLGSAIKSVQGNQAWGTWYHIVGTYETGTNNQKLYINGNLISQTTNTKYDASSYLRIGRRIWNSGGTLDAIRSGGISNVIIENKVRTEDKIVEYYNQTKSNYELLYNASYDFTTGTISDFSSLGWSVPSQCSMSSNGLTTSSSWSDLILDNAGGLNDALQSANKVTMELVWYKTGSAGEHAFSLMNGNTEVNVLYGNGVYTQVTVGGTNIYTKSQTQSTNTPHTMKSVCDLVNKSASYEDTGVPITGTATLTDTQISNMRACGKLKLAVQSGVYIKSFSIKIE